ncbi:hypothetical protein GBO34_00760 [Roseivirga pacifica]|uniref:hypothetical protein n=1 Tax=Roseivirga pacifica TaxID=1267423 RepID=UPI0020948710|nr:hypothetical protein [Roseivirga pacifica]MCO6367843.1 hypothetical protein [Roseivirga pacifica]MCO6377215.1 hypothetical protein [Roseivirga pacifica]
MGWNDILETNGSNMGGLTDVLHAVPVEDIDKVALAALESPLDSLGKTMTADIPLKSTKKFYSLYFTKGFGKLDYPLVGEVDGKSREVIVEVNIPKMSAAQEAVIDAASNGPCVIICRDAEGQLRICGINVRKDGTLAVDWPMYMDTDAATTGAAGTDKKGHLPVWKCANPVSPLFYTGAIDIDDAT